MCCFGKTKGKKGKCSDSTTTTLPLQTAHSSTTNTIDTTAGGRKGGRLLNRTGSAGKTSRPKVGDVHKKILTIEENQKVSEKQMVEAMQLLGCSTVNTTIIQRLEKASKEMCEKSQVSTRQGDIQFTLPKNNNIRKQAKDDDTLYPLHNKPDNPGGGHQNDGGDEKEIELLKEDCNDEPNSENYMWNTREIRYTCVDMIRHLDKNVLIESVGDPCGDEEIEQKIEWDPFAPLHVLENRPVFDCHTLRKNTFLTMALSSSTKAEQKAAKSAIPKISAPKKVKVNEPSKVLTRLRPEYSMRTTCTVGSNSLDITPITQETVDVTPKSNFFNRK
uniref:Uncharacterized protein n=1 Tax=Panagrolaimus superbus TaxID=310955 RepID=A0A914YB50_9BILA